MVVAVHCLRLRGNALALPVGLIVWRTFEHGLAPVWDALTALGRPARTLVVRADCTHCRPREHRLRRSVRIGVGAAPFSGKALLSALVDLPLGVSPIVVGLALVVVYGRFGWFGPWLFAHNVQVIFALPGMVLATIFVSMPFVVREVVPVLHEIGTEQEQAAATLGASALQTFGASRCRRFGPVLDTAWY